MSPTERTVPNYDDLVARRALLNTCKSAICAIDEAPDMLRMRSHDAHAEFHNPIVTNVEVTSNGVWALLNLQVAKEEARLRRDEQTQSAGGTHPGTFEISKGRIRAAGRPAMILAVILGLIGVGAAAIYLLRVCGLWSIP